METHLNLLRAPNDRVVRKLIEIRWIPKRFRAVKKINKDSL